ncbi:hypothetical protein EZ428_23175 [Pedobacter frigiditerrae]|uniref:Outer membrane protein beta-barrel domain-containing protein n=1 Tax=Pedobacter frigiditerrae TaxID=2530452 RepID=A0A4R0MJ56_9SPHI|nr:hypothetical protein [Pedobacter frigiditerrae]TCC86615.1 hypothetical protein EZ428_23175 [Pedobacter frigiditerrae]
MKCILIITLSLLMANNCIAQQFSLGLEAGLGTKSGIYGQSYVALQNEAYYFKIKNSRVGEIGLFGDRPSPKLFDYALMVGKNFNVGSVHNFQLGAGLAFTGKVTQGKYIRSGGQENSGILLFGYSVYEKIQKNTIGLPIEAKYNLKLGNIIAISLSANANLNAIQSFAGLSVGTFLGNVR